MFHNASCPDRSVAPIFRVRFENSSQVIPFIEILTESTSNTGMVMPFIRGETIWSLQKVFIVTFIFF
jgi:hypothetical protein